MVLIRDAGHLVVADGRSANAIAVYAPGNWSYAEVGDNRAD
jgi:hypothetical protein